MHVIIKETRKLKKVSWFPKETENKYMKILEGRMEETERYMELREKILENTLHVFNKKGLKFTMDDIAGAMGISKKTIYTVFKDKEELFLAVVDYMFDSIKESEKQVLQDDTLSTVDKIRMVLGVMPDGYKDVDFRQLYILKDKFPKIYAKVEERLESGWEQTIALIEKGMEEGVIRKISIPIVKLMMEAALEQFFQRDILLRSGLTYQEALTEVVNILVDGMTVASERR